LAIKKVRGRSGIGARNHCVHGKNEIVVEDVLDMKPFDYFTVTHNPQGTPMALDMTYHFTPTERGGTHLRITFRGRVGRLIGWPGKVVCNIGLGQVKKTWALDKIDEWIEAERTAQATEAVDVSTP
jgi:hypothetical protein